MTTNCLCFPGPVHITHRPRRSDVPARTAVSDAAGRLACAAAAAVRDTGVRDVPGTGSVLPARPAVGRTATAAFRTGRDHRADRDARHRCGRWRRRQGVAADGVPAAFLSVTTRVHKAGPQESGVQRADADLGRKPGTPAGVMGADDDKFREVESSRNRVTQAEISVLYRNVVIGIIYHNDTLGEKGFTQPLPAVSALAIEKL